MTHNLQRWDIIFVKQDELDPTGHPAVVLSPPDILNDTRHHRINVLVGTKKPPAASARTSATSRTSGSRSSRFARYAEAARFAAVTARPRLEPGSGCITRTFIL